MNRRGSRSRRTRRLQKKCSKVEDLPCADARREGINHRIGSLVPYRGPLGEGQAPWLGHSRTESPTPPNSTPVQLDFESYVEKGVRFEVPRGKSVEAYLVKNDRFPQGEGLFIVTRPATQEELARCPHPRHPKLVDRKE